MKTLLFGILQSSIIVILFLSQGCAVDAVRLNRQSQVYIKHNQFEKARDLLIMSFEVDFENAASHYWLAQCYEALGEESKVIWEYELAVRFDPSMELAQMSYIKALYRSGDIEKSKKATEFFLEHKEGVIRDFIRLAENFLSEKMDAHALLCYYAAARAEPRSPLPFVLLADYYKETGDQEKEIENLILAVKIDPVYPDLAKRLGQYDIRLEIPQPTVFPQPSALEKELFDLDQ